MSSEEKKAIICAVGTLTIRKRVSSTGDEPDSPHEFLKRSRIEFHITPPPYSELAEERPAEALRMKSQKKRAIDGESEFLLINHGGIAARKEPPKSRIG